VSNYVRLRGYFSNPKGVRQPKSLGNTDLKDTGKVYSRNGNYNFFSYVSGFYLFYCLKIGIGRRFLLRFHTEFQQNM
jgi:hypothetical protein